ncbi:Cytochrome c [compost metagenome]
MHRRVTALLASALFLFPSPLSQAKEAEPELRLMLNGKEKVFTRTQLLAHPRAKRLQVPHDVTYRRPMTYQAVPVAALFEGESVDQTASVQFVATDGFSASIDPARLLNTSESGAIAYIAFEPENQPWPPIRPGSKTSAGPFYVVWSQPERSKISPEEWPFHLAKFVIQEPVRVRLPAIRPDAGLADEHPVNRGFALFQRNCFACHTLNGSGDGSMGPDLNIPMSPTEYLTEGALRQYVRDPQSVRRWAGSRMSGFSPSVLSDADLDDLVAYLRHMAKRKVPSRP